jgi:membrane-bound lytic murein transglycosylase D
MAFGATSIETPNSIANSSETELKISYSIETLPVNAADSDIDLWERIRAGFKLPDSDPRLTRVHEQTFTRNTSHIERIAQRSRPYLFYIVEEVERRGMPMEIALLPMIESAFNPQALSPMKASGIWQFIPSTGKVYGLQQNAWYDGRRDIIQATNAALDYLQKLYGMFGDWELGAGRLQLRRGVCCASAIAGCRQQLYLDQITQRNPQLRTQAGCRPQHHPGSAALRYQSAGIAQRTPTFSKSS